MFGLNRTFSAEKEIPQPSISEEDLVKAHTMAFSKQVDYSERIKIARSLAMILEKMNRTRNARYFCLDFYSSVSSMLQDDWNPVETPVLAEPYSQFADAIDKGKRKETIERIHNLLLKEGGDDPHPSLGVLALKSDEMSTVYGVFFSDLADKKIAASSYHVLGILAARESRMVEAERFMEKAKGGLGAPMLERWLTIDLIKISIVNNRIAEAKVLIDRLLEQNPKDAYALNMTIFSNLKNGKKDLARQQLSRLIPLLYEDPYLLAETAKLAIELKELDTAVSILETFESKVESNWDFFRVFSLVRKMQGKNDESVQWMEKANTVRQTRVSVSGAELSEAIQQSENGDIQGLDSLATVYLSLLNNDVHKAVQVLESLDKTGGYERFVLATILRRNEQYNKAISTLKDCKQNSPAFRPYQVLAQLADLSFRAGNEEEATAFYQELKQTFPGSRQAEVAERYLKNPSDARSENAIAPMKISGLMSRYSQYAAPFVLKEIWNYWGDRFTFASINSLLGTSHRRGLMFGELFSVINNWTRYQAVPFNGKSEAVQEFLSRQIPVLYCQGEMFLNQSLAGLSIVTGANPAIGQFYAEGVLPSDPHLLTEADLLEGICLAVYPTSVDFEPSTIAKQCIQLGEEYIQLCKDALAIDNNPDSDTSRFIKRRNSILKETSPVFLPHQLAFARRVIRKKTYTSANKYLNALEAMGQKSAQFWSLYAFLQSRKNNAQAQTALDRALKIVPGDPQFIQAKALVMLKAGQIADAISLMENLRAQFPESPSISAHLLLLYENSGDAQKKEAEANRLKNYFNVENIQIDSGPSNDSTP